MSSNKTKKYLFAMVSWTIVFIIYTLAVKFFMVAQVGPKGTSVGFGKLNKAIHQAIGTNMIWDNITDVFVIIAIVLAITVAVVGIIQAIARKSAKKIDKDILWTIIYYFLIIGMYFIFEQIPINYRPIITEGTLEYSYPSSHIMVLLCISFTLMYQVCSRVKNSFVKNCIKVIIIIFLFLSVVGRILSGVHWITDIIGSILISIVLSLLYMTIIIFKCKGL
jgi:undecaprenyl-diphosphatase